MKIALKVSVSASPRMKFQMPRSCLGLGHERIGLGLGLETERLGLASVSRNKASCTSLVITPHKSII